MKHFISSRMAVYGCLLLLLTVTLANAQREERGNVKTSIAPVVQFTNLSAVIPYAGASLSRNNSGVFGTISTSGIAPGNVVTLWWAIFNNPHACASTPCVPIDLNTPAVNGSLQFGGGQIVGPNGRADFTGYLGIGDSSGFYRLFPNMPDPPVGLVHPKGAEIHLVIRDHGPASSDPTILSDQLNSFGGGCAIQTCRNIQAAIFGR